jgi:hypothetical protein
LVAVLVVPALEDGSEVDEDESDDELPDSFDGADVAGVPDP